jgi:prohibitin 2
MPNYDDARKRDVNDINKRMIKYTTWGVVALLVVILLAGSVSIVPAGSRGVELTWGKASPVPRGEGLNFKIPLAQKIVKMSVQTQKYEAHASAASSDLQIVSTNIAVNYHVVPDQVPNLYKDIGVHFEDRVIQPTVQEVVKATTAQFTAEELISKRPEVKAMIQERLEQRLITRGVIVEDISITDFDFSNSFNEAIEQKVTAEQLKLKAERDLERIQVEAQQAQAKAIGEKNAKIAEAEGQAEAIRIIETQLSKSPRYIEYLYAQKWDGELPKVTGGSIPLIDVNRLE